MSIPKLAVLATGLTAAMLVGTMAPQAAQAFPTYGTGCTGCHTAGGSVTATPSAASVAPGAAYTVALAYTGGTGSPVGYAITGNGANVNAVSAGPASMTAPATVGSYTYTVWMRSGVVATTTYTITVAAAPVVVTTTTALAVSPTAGVAPATANLTATVTGAGAAGTVEFFNGTASLGTSPVSAGVAAKSLTGLAVGTYSYTAKFIPTNAALFTTSTSTAKTFVVTAPVPVAVTTTTALAVSPATAVAPANATLTATVTGAGAAGTVQFFNGTTSLGTSPVAGGVATKALTALAAGTYSYTANFIPTSTAAFTPSTSTAKTLVVSAAAVITTTALAVSPTAGVAPANATLTATVTGAGAAGTVQFFNGTTSLGTSPVAAGVATKALTGLAAGSYSYTAKFIPTNAALFTTSTSTATTFVVTVPVTTPPVTTTTPPVTTTTPPVTTTTPPVTTTTPPVTTTTAPPVTTTAPPVTTTTPPVTSGAKITRLSPNVGYVGTKVTISGTGFGTPGVVKFGSTIARVSSWKTSSIVVTVPGSYYSVSLRSGDEDGTPVWYQHDQGVSVTVTPKGVAASNAVLFVIKSAHYDD